MNHPVYTTSEPKKHPAFILAVDADYFTNQLIIRDGGAADGPVSAFAEPINMFPHEVFLSTVQSDLVIREREYLDNGVTVHESRRGADNKFKKGNPRYKQILPYLVARQEQEDGSMLFFPYRRTEKVGESRLAKAGSVGYGGHVDLEDVVCRNSVINLLQTIIFSLLREANEEFTVLDQYGIKVAVEADWFSFGDLFILDNTTPVNELHLGLIMHLDIPKGFTLIATEDELAKLPPMTAEQMLTDPAFKPESWTEIYLNFYVNNGWYFKRSVGIDHGGEQVGQVSPTFLNNTNLQALEAGVSDNGAIAATGFAADFNESAFRAEMPNPTEADLQDPTFNAIYQAAKGWDVNSPEHYAGYCGFNGSHAKIILDAVRSVPGRTMVKVDVAEGEDPQEAAELRTPRSEQEAMNLGRGGFYALSTTPANLAEIQNKAAEAYHAHRAEVLTRVDAIQDANATADRPYPLVDQDVADGIAKEVTGDPDATFESVVGQEGNWRATKSMTVVEKVAVVDTRSELDAALEVTAEEEAEWRQRQPVDQLAQIPGNSSIVPDGYKSNIDWSNVLTGSTQNAVNLDFDDLRRQQLGGTAVTNAATGSQDAVSEQTGTK